jgi:hypothetical protein
MRPLARFAFESGGVKGHAYIAKCGVIESVCGAVMPFVTTISKRADRAVRANRGAGNGALC